MTLDDIRKLAEQALEDDKRATPGPWRVNPDFPLKEEDGSIRPTECQEAVFGAGTIDYGYGSGPEPEVVIGSTWYDGPHTLVSVTDATVIAAARTREPQLAAFALAVLDVLADFASDDQPRRGVAESIEMAIERAVGEVKP
jgi:hypothetical protein